MPPALPLLDPGPLVEGTLQLVAPQQRFVPELLAAARDRETRRDSREFSKVTRQSLAEFFSIAPGGRFPGDSVRNLVPAYHFWMRLSPPRPFGIAGGIALRIGDTEDLRQWVGHIGYHVYPKAQGRHLAERSCRLLLPLAKANGLNELWITCNPDNLASRRTCERLGATLVDIVPVPIDHPLWARGDVAKCRYQLPL